MRRGVGPLENRVIIYLTLIWVELGGCPGVGGLATGVVTFPAQRAPFWLDRLDKHKIDKENSQNGMHTLKAKAVVELVGERDGDVV